MIIQVLRCPYCQGTEIVRHGMSPEGKQRYRCRQCREGRGRTFLLDYAYAGQSPAVKQQIIEMAMKASGIRDTARVLHISPTTVLKELKKRHLTCNRCITLCYSTSSPTRWRWESVGLMSLRCVAD